MRGDVSQDADCRAMAAAAVDAWGRIDALVNNAGVSLFGADAAWDALDAQSFQRILGVNTVGTFQMVRACLPHLKAARGAIVNVSSVAGSLGIGSSIPYIASKGAINAMTLHLARTLAPGDPGERRLPGLHHLPLVRRRPGPGRATTSSRPAPKPARRWAVPPRPRTWPRPSSGWSMAPAPSPAS